MTVATLTARDIAKHIQRPGESLTAAVDRLRNWTKMGIIEPSGEQNPGTGHKKQYSIDALPRAVILQALIDAMGSPALTLSPILDSLAKGFRRRAEGAKRDLVVFSKEASGQGFEIQFANRSELARCISKSDYAVHTVIDLGRIYERVAREQGEI